MATGLTAITDYLLTQSWQIALIVLVVGAVNLALRNKSAHVRYLLWLVVLAKCLVPPFYAVPLAILPQQERAEPPPMIPSAEALPPRGEVADAHMARPSEPRPAMTETTRPPTVDGKRQNFAIHEWLGIGWMVGACAFLTFNLLRALRANLWLWRRRKALPAELRSNIEKLFSAHGVTSVPDIWLVEGFNQPFVWGLVRGSIYLPVDFLNINRAEHQRSVLGHELSHVLRFDAAVNILQVVAQAIFWFHPLVWWANRKIRQEREKCCDEMAVARLNTSPRDYSTAILEALAAKCEQTRPVPSLAVAGPVKNIEERIKTMLRPGKKFHKRPSIVAATIVLLLAVLTVPTAFVLSARAGTQTTVKLLHKAVSAGDVEQVKSLISEGADVNAKDDRGRTALHKAAYWGRKDVAEVLIAKGANVNAKDLDANTPIHLASIPNRAYKGPDIAIIRRLVANGADVNARNAKGETPAHVAAAGWRNAHADTVLALNELGANVYAKDKSGNTPLHVAAKQARVRVIEDLIAKGAPVKHANAKGETPLHVAAGKEVDGDPRRNVVRVLVAHSTHVDQRDQSQSTPLHKAACAGHTDIVEILVAEGANVNAKDMNGHIPAYLALRATYFKVADLLIDKGADTSSIYFAAYLGELPRVMNMMATSSSVNTEDETGFTPLHAAAAGGHKDVVEYLISKDANTTAEAQPGWTALSYAAASNHMEIVELLRSKGAGAGKGASEMLFIVAGRGYADAARTLIDLGAKINVGERTALHEATAAGHKEMVALLISKGADVNAGKWTPLHVTAEAGYIDIARLLIDAGADIEAGGFTPLMMAAYNHKDMVSFLISKGANVNAKNWDGWTVLDCAKDDGGRPDIIEILKKHGAKE